MVWIWISSWKSKIKPSSYKRPRNFYWQENPTIVSSFVYCSTLEIYLWILHIKTRFAFISLFFSALSLINSLIAFPFTRSFLLLVGLLSAHSDIFLYIPRVFTDQFSGCLHCPGEVTLVGGILLLIRTIDYMSIFFYHDLFQSRWVSFCPSLNTRFLHTLTLDLSRSKIIRSCKVHRI